MNTIALSLFSNRISSICDEMGAVLRHSAFSPNIRDRLDYSCAVFDAQGELCAQAAHIPVHLGSMAYAMRDVVTAFDWQDGDVVVLNDPYLGGTHLPDITLLSPLIIDDGLMGFIANRAHHADIGADSPGSMPISRTLQEEGLLIKPVKLVSCGDIQQPVLDYILDSLRNPVESRGDFNAQLSSVKTGVSRLTEVVRNLGPNEYQEALTALNEYAETLARSALREIPDGDYAYEDVMDDDGLGNDDIPIKVVLEVRQGNIKVDFNGTSNQVDGNINCPISVAAASVYYVFRCLMPNHTPASAGSFRPLSLTAPNGCLVNAVYPAAVAAGNVETSTRIVDVLLGALSKAIPDRIPAASHGSMNNVAMGSSQDMPWDYYETIGGGMGASSVTDGLSAVQTHMTNTLNTPIESLEMRYPLRIKSYGIRKGSGGSGRFTGGDGIIREFEFLRPASATLLTERRHHAPWGLQGADSGSRGMNLLNGKPVPAKVELELKKGDCLRIETAGGGGYG